MKTKVFLINEKTIKDNSQLNDNFFPKYLLPCIRSAQDIELQSILGECLYQSILNKVSDGSITSGSNIAYKDLLDNYIQDFLLYEVLRESVLVSNVKIANLGTKLTEDEKIVSLSEGEADLLQQSFENKANFYKRRMQDYLKNNYDSFPELAECVCNCKFTIKPNLDSAESVGLWLGGLYSK